MRAVVQRVKRASVSVDQKTVGEISNGLLVFLGIGQNDTEADITYLADKILHLRIFSDNNDKMNWNLTDMNGELLVVSQFTLYGDCRKGRRPSFDNAMEPKQANSIYERFIAYCRSTGIHTKKGIFGADMQIELINDGPVTILLDSQKVF